MLVGADIGDFSLCQDHNAIGQLHRSQAVGDNYRSFVPGKLGKPVLDRRFLHRVNGGCGLVEKNPVVLPKKPPGDGYSLPLTSGEINPVKFPGKDGVVPLRQ